MALTNPTLKADNVAFSGKDIRTAASIYQYTSVANERVIFLPRITNAAGNGDYIVYLKRTRGGVVTLALPKTTATAASGETGIEFPSIEVYCKSGDIIDIMVDGLSGDNAAAGTIDIVALNFSTLEAADNIGINWADVANPTSTVALTNTTISAVGVTATVAISATTAAQVAAGNYSVTSYYTFDQTVTSTSTADLNAADVWFAVKQAESDADSAAIIMIKKGATGLMYLNGAAPVSPVVAADGSVTVSGSSGAWSIRIKLLSQATAVLDGVKGSYVAALKYSIGTDGAGDFAIDEGTCDINQGIVQAV